MQSLRSISQYTRSVDAANIDIGVDDQVGANEAQGSAYEGIASDVVKRTIVECAFESAGRRSWIQNRRRRFVIAIAHCVQEI